MLEGQACACLLTTLQMDGLVFSKHSCPGRPLALCVFTVLASWQGLSFVSPLPLPLTPMCLEPAALSPSVPLGSPRCPWLLHCVFPPCSHSACLCASGFLCVSPPPSSHSA